MTTPNNNTTSLASTNRTEVRRVITQFAGQQRIITTPKVFVELTGDHVSALLLNQIIYWSEINRYKGGWFYKSAEEWQDELGMSRYQVSRSMKVLERLGAETKLKKANGAPTTHYRIDLEFFISTFIDFCESKEKREKERAIERNLQMEVEETGKSNLEFLAGDIKETANSLTEDYQKTTPEDDDIRQPDYEETANSNQDPWSANKTSSVQSSSSPLVEKPQTKFISAQKYNEPVATKKLKAAQVGYTPDQLEAIALYQTESGDRGIINAGEVAELVKEYSLDWFVRAYKIMRKSGKTANHLNFVKGILQNCKAEGHAPGDGGPKKTGVKGSDGRDLGEIIEQRMRNYRRKQQEAEAEAEGNQ